MRANRRMKALLAAADSSLQFKIGLSLLVFIVLIAFFANLIAPMNPYALGKDLLVPPGKGHILGTDNLGRDVFSMLIFGTRTSLMVGIVAALISGIIGVVLGGISGYIGGKADVVFTEINNMFMMIPTFFLVLIIIALFGSSLFNVMLVIGLTGWPGNARLMRAEAMSLRERTFVKGAVAIGETRSGVIFRYVIPAGIYPVIANTTMNIGGAILTEAGLSFLGLGDPNVISWGQMISAGRMYLVNGWWVSTFSGLAVLLIVLVFYLIGDGIGDILNPQNMEGNRG